MMNDDGVAHRDIKPGNRLAEIKARLEAAKAAAGEITFGAEIATADFNAHARDDMSLLIKAVERAGHIITCSGWCDTCKANKAWLRKHGLLPENRSVQAASEFLGVEPAAVQKIMDGPSLAEVMAVDPLAVDPLKATPNQPILTVGQLKAALAAWPDSAEVWVGVDLLELRPAIDTETMGPDSTGTRDGFLVRAELPDHDEVEREVTKLKTWLLMLDTPHPLALVVARLVDAVDALFAMDYDDHGWETIDQARAAARKWLGEQADEAAK